MYLLHRDGRVTKTKKSISTLQTSGLLTGVKYVLLPIQSKKSVYIAVLGDFLNAEDFHTMTIRMHVKLMCGYHDRSNDSPPWGIDENILFDYWTTTMVAKTWEEFYHVIHMAICNCMVEYIQQSVMLSQGHSSMAYHAPIYYFRIEDLSIRSLDGEGRDIIEPFEFSMEALQYGYGDIDEDRLDGYDPPDEYTSGNAQLCEILSERYGIYHDRVGSGWKWSFRKDEDGTLTWREENRIGNLFSNVTKVIFSSGDSFSPFIMLSDDEYNQLIRIENADAFAIPLIYAPEKYMDEKPVYEYLTPTTYFDVPRYEFSDDNDSPQAFQSALAMLDSYMGETIASYEYHDSHEIAFLIAYLNDMMEAVCEACKVECATRLDTNDLLGLSSWCTVMINVILEISESTPSTKYLHIMTDRYQDVPVDIQTVCVILGSEEKSH